MTEPEPSAPAGTAGFLAAGGAGKRAGLAAGPRAVYQAVLRAFATQGRPPEPAELEGAARRHEITAGRALATLAATSSAWTTKAGSGWPTRSPPPRPRTW